MGDWDALEVGKQVAAIGSAPGYAALISGAIVSSSLSGVRLPGRTSRPINVPEMEDIVWVSLSCTTSDQTVPLCKDDMDELLEYLSEGNPTRQAAINDSPMERTHYSISLQTDIREYRYFIYKKGIQVYIAVPYEEIYETRAELLGLVLTYYQET